MRICISESECECVKCVNVYTYVCMYACMYVRVYVCVRKSVSASIGVRMHVLPPIM